MREKSVLLIALLALFLSGLGPSPALATSDREAWNRHVAEVDALYQEKDINKIMEKTKEFIAWSRHQWGKGHPNVAEALSMTAKLHFHHNQREKVEGMLKEALAIRENAYGRDHAKTVDAYEALAAFYVADERMDDAEPMLQATLEGRRLQLGADHPQLAEYLENSARSFQRLKRLDRAEGLFREALALRERLPTGDANKREDPMLGLAEIAAERGEILQAEEWYRRAAQSVGDGEAGRLKRAQIVDQQGIMLWRIGHGAEGRRLGEQALQEAEAASGHDPTRLAVWLSNVGRIHYKSGDYARATFLLNLALDNARKEHGDDPNNSLIQAIRRNLETLNRGVLLSQRGGPVQEILDRTEGSGGRAAIPQTPTTTRDGHGRGGARPTAPAGKTSRPGTTGPGAAVMPAPGEAEMEVIVSPQEGMVTTEARAQAAPVGTTTAQGGDQPIGEHPTGTGGGAGQGVQGARGVTTRAVSPPAASREYPVPPTEAASREHPVPPTEAASREHPVPTAARAVEPMPTIAETAIAPEPPVPLREQPAAAAPSMPSPARERSPTNVQGTPTRQRPPADVATTTIAPAPPMVVDSGTTREPPIDVAAQTRDAQPATVGTDVAPRQPRPTAEPDDKKKERVQKEPTTDRQGEWREARNTTTRTDDRGDGRMPHRGEYFVSTGCFGDSEFLNHAEERIRRLALPGFRTQANLRSGKLTCVFTGPYATDGDARRALNRLHGEGGLSGLEIRQASKDW
ncbi:MAG: tetratricopeptide repeat protein [Magnetococcales bacterium]|nr:tetratricopeptide repeat protein [Magnetococcales bacterium]